MPIYEFECSKCGKKIERIISSSDKREIYCCDTKTKRLISLCSVKVGFRPFRSQCLDGNNKHIYFNTQAQMEEYHKKNNLSIER